MACLTIPVSTNYLESVETKKELVSVYAMISLLLLHFSSLGEFRWGRGHMKTCHHTRLFFMPEGRLDQMTETM